MAMCLRVIHTAMPRNETHCGMKDNEDRGLYQNKYRKTSMRLDGWDYSTPAFYFITMRTFNGILQFGNIKSAEMILNDMGEIISRAWKDSFEIRKELVCDSYVIMPNHIHGLINIVRNYTVETHGCAQDETHSRASLRRMPKSISSFVAGFKSTSTRMVNEYRKSHGECLWQAGYYDRIIRNENELFNVRNYIQCNPTAWDKDEENPDCKIKML